MIQAIPTEHNGTKYRSRTEARWAVFFEDQRIPFAYEQEGYQTYAGWYVPDFRLTAASELTFFEVKPHEPSQHEIGLAAALARGAKATVFIALGGPSARTKIWRITKTGEHTDWYFALEQGGSTAYLVTSLWFEGESFKVRNCENPPALGISPSSPLEQAGRFQFPLFDEGPARIRGKVQADKRDWRQVARATENRTFRDRFGRLPRRGGS